MKICPYGTDEDVYVNAAKALKKHITEIAPKIHTNLRMIFIDRDIDIAMEKMLKYTDYYNQTDCVMDYLGDKHYKLHTEPTSGNYIFIDT